SLLLLRNQLQAMSNVPADVYEQLTKIKRKRDEIQNLITKILRLAEQSAMAMEVCDAKYVIKKVWENVQAAHEDARTIDFQQNGSQDLVAWADHTCLASALEVLLTNAVKYGKSGEGKQNRIQCICLGPFTPASGPIPR